MMRSSVMMRLEGDGADTASLRCNATTLPMSPHHSPLHPHFRDNQWSFPVTVGFTILAIRTVLLSAIVLFIRVISCDIVVYSL